MVCYLLNTLGNDLGECVEFKWSALRCAISEAGVPKEQVTSAPTDSEEAGDEWAGTSAAPTMWLGAQNGWSVAFSHSK